MHHNSPAEVRVSRRATLHDVAELAGVSYQTVSRVVNDHPHVAAETRKRVVRAIRSLDYRPNQAAKVLATGRSYMLQLITFDLRYNDPLPPMLNMARRHGFSLIISEVNPRSPKEENAKIIQELVSRMVDGFIVYTPYLFLSYEELITLFRGVPFVLVGAELGVRVPSVSFDQRHGATLAVRHLLDLGHRHIAEISGPEQHIDARLRHETYLQLLHEAGLEPGPVVEGDYEVPSGYAGARKLLASGQPFTAVFIGNDRMAMGALSAFREAGVRVPEDVSVVGFDDMLHAAYLAPPLTTVRQDLNALARQSVDYLIARIREPGTPVQQSVLYQELIVRQSTCSLGGGK